MTITIQIGNTDNKLTQQEWANFVSDVREILENYDALIYFFGAPPNYSHYQNACWVIGAHIHLSIIKALIIQLRQKYNQTSVAWTEGSTEFI